MNCLHLLRTEPLYENLLGDEQRENAELRLDAQRSRHAHAEGPCRGDLDAPD
jgi:hypothetical protein